MSVHKDETQGTWYVSFRINGSLTKKRGFKTKKEARYYESILLKERNENNIVRHISFNDLVVEYLIYRKTSVKATTLNAEKIRINKHILPYFNKFTDINRITPKDIKSWQLSLYDKYSLNYLSSLYTIVRNIFKYSNTYYNTTNPTLKIENFKKPNEIKKEMQYFTLEEFNKFIKCVHDEPYQLFFEFLFYTGAREGEALALNWNDFNEDYTVVSINKSVDNRIKGKGYAIYPPKTSSANRKISLPKHLANDIALWFNECKLIDGFVREFFVFGDIEPIKLTTIRKKKNKACKEACVKQIRIHDFRHSHATYLISHGADIVAVSKRLGHASISVTLDTYTHLIKKKEDELLKLL